MHPNALSITLFPGDGDRRAYETTRIVAIVGYEYDISSVISIRPSLPFYTKYLGFQIKQQAKPNFAMLSRGNLELVLSTPFGPGGAAQPMPDGRKAEPGGWNRIILNVDDLAAEVTQLRKFQLHFRNDIVKGPGGSEILLEDPSGNPIELFQPSR